MMKITPSKEEVDWFVVNCEQEIKKFVETFSIEPWNYCHTVAAHMVPDMKYLFDQKLSLGVFSMSRIESIGSKLKRLLKHSTNHRWGDDEKSDHCILQAINSFYLLRLAENKMNKTTGLAS